MAHELLADSCAYFRLAQAVHPLLGVPFGEPPSYKIYVISELDKEYLRSTRLVNKFDWVNTQAYIDNRQQNLLGAAIDQFDFKETVKALTYYKDQKSYGVSKVDIVVLAVALLLNIPIITDDADVIEMATRLAYQTQWDRLRPCIGYILSAH
jgi:hypothetical protein